MLKIHIWILAPKINSRLLFSAKIQIRFWLQILQKWDFSYDFQTLCWTLEKLLSFDRKQVFWTEDFCTSYLTAWSSIIVSSFSWIVNEYFDDIFVWFFEKITHISTRSLNADREVCRLNRTSSPLYIHVRSHGFYNLA